MRVPPSDVLKQLLDDARLNEEEIEERLHQAFDAAYWRGLAPDLHVVDGSARVESGEANAAAIARAGRSLQADGVFHLRDALAPATLHHLNAAVDAVTAGRWPAAFAFVYDEPWLAPRTPAIAAILDEALGQDAMQIPNVWTHIVRPIEGAAGWRPHIDGPARSRMSIWTALSDATVENGCMHVVPRGSAPARFAERVQSMEPLTMAEALGALHSTRALPAAAGDVLGWSFDIVHWGGLVRSVGAERRSLSFEFIAGGETPEEGECPLVPLRGPLPELESRLRAIAAGILTYQRHERPLVRYAELARRILSKLHQA